METMKFVEDFWERARIPMKKPQRVKEKNNLFIWAMGSTEKENRTTATQKANEQKFVNFLINLFDIAHANAMSMITLEEDQEFLSA